MNVWAFASNASDERGIVAYIFARKGDDEAFQVIQAVVDASAPAFLHQRFHGLEEKSRNDYNHRIPHATKKNM